MSKSMGFVMADDRPILQCETGAKDGNNSSKTYKSLIN